MFGRGLLPILPSPLDIDSAARQKKMPWLRKAIRDTAYLFLPFTFVTFIILLGGVLLVTWGHLSNAVLVGFCVTAGLLIGFFLLCHLVLYCSAWAAAFDPEKRSEAGGSSTAASSGHTTPNHGIGASSLPSTGEGGKAVGADGRGRRQEQDAGPSFQRNGVINAQEVCLCKSNLLQSSFDYNLLSMEPLLIYLPYKRARRASKSLWTTMNYSCNCRTNARESRNVCHPLGVCVRLRLI